MKAVRRPSSRMNFDSTMTPMIDIIFQLQIFFLCTAGFSLPESQMPTFLPGRQSAAVAEPLEDFEPVTITLDQKANRLELALNGNPLMGFADLNEKLAILAAASREMPIQLDVKPTVDLQNLISVYDAAHKHQLRKIVLLNNDQ